MQYRVLVTDLIATLEANREAHRGIYEQAVAAYREMALTETTALVDRLIAGEVIRVALALPVPEDHTEDYDRAIRMLNMTLDAGTEEITLEDHEAQQYVMDQWGWKRTWTDNTVSYTNAN